MRPRVTALAVSLPFWVGLVVFVAMFPFHPTVDLDLVNYLPTFLLLGAILGATSYGAWRLLPSADRAKARLVPAAASLWGLCLAAVVWAAYVDLAPYRVWDWLFSAPALGAMLGGMALAVLAWLPGKDEAQAV